MQDSNYRIQMAIGTFRRRDKDARGLTRKTNPKARSVELDFKMREGVVFRTC